MKQGLMAILTGIFFFSTLNGALPPLYENIAELKMILNDQRLGSILQSGESIQEIIHVDDGYLIKTNKSSVVAKIEYEKMDHPGPAKFHVEFQNYQSLEALK